MGTGATARSLTERLRLEPPLEPNSDHLVRRPHAWLDRGRELPAPALVVRWARSAEGGHWMALVTWTRQDPQRPETPEHHTEWVDAARLSPA